jgi:cyanate lyase
MVEALFMSKADAARHWFLYKLAERELSVREAERQCGMPQARLQRLLDGKGQFKSDEIEAIAKVLGIGNDDELADLTRKTFDLGRKRER